MHKLFRKILLLLFQTHTLIYMHLKFSFQLKFQHSFPFEIYRSSGLVVLLNIPLAISAAESLHNHPYSNCDQMMTFVHLYYT